MLLVETRTTLLLLTTVGLDWNAWIIATHQAATNALKKVISFDDGDDPNIALYFFFFFRFGYLIEQVSLLF
jgi:hypothetical protein